MNASFFELNRGAFSYNKAISESLIKLCYPVLSNLGLTYFCYNKFVPGSRYLSIGTDVDWYETVLCQGWNRSLFFKDTSRLEQREWKVIWDLTEDNDIVAALRAHGFVHGLSVYRRRDNYFEGWHFATKHGNSNVNYVYLNEMALLDRFISFFSERGEAFVSCRDQSRLAHYYGNYQFELPQSSNDGLPELREDFLMKTDLKKWSLRVGKAKVKLSRREVECLNWLSQGKTSKEMSHRLNISPRTVEHYLGSIKNKTGLSDRSELIQAYVESDISRWFGKVSSQYL